jgi:hypothetical protein
MGQIVNVVERASSRPGIVRFETNRVLSGTGHDRFVAGQLIEGERTVDELARRLFNRGGIAAIHINGGVVTVDLEKGFGPEGLADLIRGLYTFYEAPDARPDAVAAEAALAAAPDPERAAAAPVLQEVSAAVAADVPPMPTPGDAAAERNEALAAAAPAEAAPAPEPEPVAPTDVPVEQVADLAPSADPPPSDATADDA